MTLEDMIPLRAAKFGTLSVDLLRQGLLEMARGAVVNVPRGDVVGVRATIYRVERITDGRGPYNDPSLWHLHDKATFTSQPNPDYEKEWGWQRMSLDQRREYLFGFRSLDALSRWFDYVDREVMHEQGFHIVVYDAEDAHHSRTQSIFHRYSAVKQDTLSLLDERVQGA